MKLKPYMSPFGRLSSRAGRALEALAVTGCLLGVAVGPAAANHPEDAPHCEQTAGTNACLWVTSIGLSNIYEVKVGIDVSMGPEDVQAAIDHGNVFSARIWGDDGSDREDQFLFDIPLKFQGPGPNGYSGDFEVPGNVSCERLNEDDESDDPDEIVGKIDVFFPRTERTVTYETGVVSHSFCR